jgi:hypothetical protein
MHINLTYIGVATLLFTLAFLRDYNIREQEKFAQKDCVKELLTELFGHFPYNQRKMLPLRTYLSVEMMQKYEQMRLNGYERLYIQREMERDADRFLEENMQHLPTSKTNS